MSLDIVVSARDGSTSRDRGAAALGRGATPRYLYTGLVALMLAPVLIWPIPRADDIVNHWARLTLLNMSADDPLRALYAVKFAIIPNLGVDLLYLALSPILSAQSVARLAWALAIVLPAWGAWRINRALFGKPQLAILLVPTISYNLTVTVGLVNYSLGVGVALLALAWAFAAEGKPFWVRLIVLNLVSVALLFCHVLALMAFCLAFGLRELTPNGRGEWSAALARGARSPLYVALGLALLAFAERTPAGFELAGNKSFVFNAPFYAMTSYDTLMRLGVLLAIALAVVTRKLAIAPRMAPALVAFAALILLMPSAWGAGNLLDARLAVFWAYLALAALGWEVSGKYAGAVVAALVALGVARFASVIPAWSRFEHEAIVMRSAMAAIEPGSRVLVVTPPSEVCRDSDMPLLNNLTTLAVVDRRAFVNTLFADPGMQPVRPVDSALLAAPKMAMSAHWLAPEDRASLGPLARSPWADAFLNWRDHFDTIISLHGKCDGRLDAPGLERVGVSDVADVYRVK